MENLPELSKSEQVEQLFPFSPTEPRTITKDEIERLHETFGIDPALAIAEGRGDELPADGWLIYTQIFPGYQWEISICGYSGRISDTYVEYSDNNRVSAIGYLNSFMRYELAYNNPAFLSEYSKNSPGDLFYKSYPDTRIETVQLEAGGRLLYPTDPTINDINRPVMGGWDWFRIEYDGTCIIDRVVCGMEGVGAVLADLGANMGLGENDIRTLITTVGQKIGRD